MQGREYSDVNLARLCMEDVTSQKLTSTIENFREHFCSNNPWYKTLCENNMTPEMYYFFHDSYELLSLLEEKEKQKEFTIDKTILSLLQNIVNNYVKDDAATQINLTHSESKTLRMLAEQPESSSLSDMLSQFRSTITGLEKLFKLNMLMSTSTTKTVKEDFHSNKWQDYHNLCEKSDSLEIYRFLRDCHQLLLSLEKKEEQALQNPTCTFKIDDAEHSTLQNIVNSYIKKDASEKQVNITNFQCQTTLVGLAKQKDLPTLADTLSILRSIITEIEQFLESNKIYCDFSQAFSMKTPTDNMIKQAENTQQNNQIADENTDQKSCCCRLF